MATHNTSINKKKEIVNSECKKVPDRCPKCGSEIGLFIKGEPVYIFDILPPLKAVGFLGNFFVKETIKNILSEAFQSNKLRD